MIDATDYSIFVGQQALYPVSFHLDNWTVEAWIRRDWLARDGRRYLFLWHLSTLNLHPWLRPSPGEDLELTCPPSISQLINSI